MAPATHILFPGVKKRKIPGQNGVPPSGTSQGTSTDTISPSKRARLLAARPPGSPSPAPGTPGTSARPRPPPPKSTANDGKLPPPEGPYSEFKLMSSALNGWKYDVMKFDSRKPVDLMTWSQPVRLNRKELKRNEAPPPVGGPVAVGPMLGPDGKPVIGADGKIVYVDADGRPIRPDADNKDGILAGGSGAGGSGSGGGGKDGKGKDKDKAAMARKKFQKKTKQVFLVPEATRQLRREERYPWVMEDAEKEETWVGQMEEAAKSEVYAMFMPAPNDIFKFVPAHRWYKFHKKPKYYVPNLEEAENLMTKIQKNKDPERWLLRNRGGQGPSEATVAMFKTERAGSVIPTSGPSLGPGGRKLKTVDNGMAGLFDEDDEDGGQRRRERETGAEGDLDELDFEETFADDEEKVEADGEDEDAKELEERLKKEYKQANKTREGYIDESEEEEDDNKLSGAGKDMRKLMKKLEKDLAYDDSDEEKNPYASEESESEEEEPQPTYNGPAIQPPEPRADSRANSQTPSANGVSGGIKTPSAAGSVPPGAKADSPSRATSPVPGHGGHSIVAKRATSPKVPKLKGSGGPSRATSPLAGGVGSRATSPVAAGSPPSQGSTLASAGVKPSNKRKATDDPNASGGSGGGSAPVKAKKHKGPTGELEVSMLVDWLRQTPNATTRDCIQHFTPYLTTHEKKERFAAMVKEVATLKDRFLVLRNAYRSPTATGEAASPTPANAD